VKASASYSAALSCVAGTKYNENLIQWQLPLLTSGLTCRDCVRGYLGGRVLGLHGLVERGVVAPLRGLRGPALRRRVAQVAQHRPARGLGDLRDVRRRDAGGPQPIDLS
jgi:hypothetical protein